MIKFRVGEDRRGKIHPLVGVELTVNGKTHVFACDLWQILDTEEFERILENWLKKIAIRRKQAEELLETKSNEEIEKLVKQYEQFYRQRMKIKFKDLISH